ncbi:MAG TPA: PadR family transcriptional regulator [Egibacteraceae bacterium]|nr:PadR family transcriptional regulator [Egibacteraceae bacterium]
MGRRFFRHGELHLVLLALLERRPMHGYQLLQDLEQRFAPYWTPSPGSIYPAVDALVAEGLLAPAEADGRTVFAVTGEGAAALERRREQVAEVEARTGVRLRPHDAVDAAVERLLVRVRAAERQVPPQDVVIVLERAEAELEALSSERGRA